MTRAIPIAHARHLDEEGYVRLDGFIAPARHRRIVERIDALFAEEGESAGSEFRQEPGARRLANLADKGDVFIDCVVDETVGQYLAHVLGPRFKLSSLNARSANPHSAQSQPLHIDAGRAARRGRLLGVQHRLAARRLHDRERRAAGGAGITPLGPAAPGRRSPIRSRPIRTRCSSPAGPATSWS